MKIWHRYFLQKLASAFFFLLICMFGVYALVDLSIHGMNFLGTELSTLLFYYLRQYAMHLDLFAPLCLLLASLKVLFDLNGHLELVALQMGGLSRKKLLVPFFVFATAITLICYANHEWIAPDATNAALTFKKSHAKKQKKDYREHLHRIALGDHSELIFDHFDEETSEIFDAFWIRETKEIWHFKTLSIKDKPPTGRFVDRLAWKNRMLIKAESFNERKIAELPLTIDMVAKPFTPFECRPLSTLAREALIASSDAAGIRSHLHYKLAVPLLSFIALFGIAPFAMQFSRSRPAFLIVALSLFGFVILMTLFDSCLILGENQVLPAAIALWAPLIGAAILTLRRFAKL